MKFFYNTTMKIPEYIWHLIFKINRNKRRRLDFNRAYTEMSRVTTSKLTFARNGWDEWFEVMFLDFSMGGKWSTPSFLTIRKIRNQVLAPP